MSTTTTPIPATTTTQATTNPRFPITHLLTILLLWAALFATSLATPPLQDDADATHAQAAQAMLSTGDYITLHVNGIRYLEKPPLPYWITALSLHLFHAEGDHLANRAAFAIHLPLALTVLGLTLLGYTWSRRAFPTPATPNRAALYTALFTLTSTGVFLFTRIFIPDALLSLLLATALYTFLLSITANPVSTEGAGVFTPLKNGKKGMGFSPGPGPGAGPGAGAGAGAPGLASETWVSRELSPYLLWISLALAVLTKGLVALVLFFATALIFLTLTQQLHLLPRLKPKTGILLFLLIAAPWHILAGLRNTQGPNGHGFFWFYFVNEHVLRFLGQRVPRDYNKLPAALYWSLHLLWLFPWSLFFPTALLVAYRAHRTHQAQRDLDPHTNQPLSRLDLLRLRNAERRSSSQPERSGVETSPYLRQPPTFTRSTILLLALFSAIVLVFFSLSTNQEYYTFPIYLPLLILLSAALASHSPGNDQVPRGFSLGSHGAARKEGVLTPDDAPLYPLSSIPYTLLFLLGATISIALLTGLYTSRHLPYTPDIGSLLAHRGVGGYTLSLSRFFDLTGPSFAALRLPATIAALAFALGPAVAWALHHKRRDHAAILTVAATSAIFLIAAHIALVRFTPMLSSIDFAQTIQTLEATHTIPPNTQVLLYGDQAYGSSIPFYLHRQVYLVDGRTSSMQFGSAFPDAPKVFLTHDQLATQWLQSPRQILFVPLEHRDDFDHLHLPSTLLAETSGKALYTNHPLTQP